MNWKTQSVLVTGAAGFIGSHLAERLVECGAKTRGLVRYNSAGSWGWLDESSVRDDIEVVAGDIRDKETVEAALKGVDIVFHLAALIGIPYSYRAPMSYVRTNIEGTINVLQAALSEEVAMVVHTSTSEVYGTARRVPIDEEHPLQGQSPYSATKIAADKLAESFHLSFGLPVATIRPFNTYGPRQSARAVIPTIITQALTQSSIRLGNLLPTRDLNYVADTVEGFVRMAQCPAAIGNVINVGSGNEISIKGLASSICRLMGKELVIACDEERLRPDNSEVERLLADNSRAREILGWSPHYTLEDGLSLTIRWMREHLNSYRSGLYSL
jgi:NAD dependent epimerase/dehydratase